MLLEKDKNGRMKEHMQGYQVTAMIVILGWVTGIVLLILDLCVLYHEFVYYILYYFRPKMQYIQNLVQDHVKRIMSEQLQHPAAALNQQRDKADYFMTKPSFMASCSVFGPKVNHKSNYFTKLEYNI